MRALRRLPAFVIDSGPVVVLATIAAVGSFSHISHLAAKSGQGGWMSWAVAVCIDLMCVMAARERQRDKRTGRVRNGPISWPTFVLVGGIGLTLAANLAEAQHTGWGYVVAGTPAAAFLVAVSMLERRATHDEPVNEPTADSPAPLTADESSVTVEPGPAPEPHPVVTTSAPVPMPAAPTAAAPASGPSPALVDFARQVANQHHNRHGQSITADQLGARLRVPADLAATIHEQITVPA